MHLASPEPGSEFPLYRDVKTRTASRIPGPAARVFASADYADHFGSRFLR